MIHTKYFKAVEEAQANNPPLADLPPFDLQRLRGKGMAARAVGWLLDHPRFPLALLRRFKPNLQLGSFLLVTRADDVREVLERQADFETPYGPEMRELAGGSTFILGLKDGPDYRRLKPLVLAAFPAEEIEARVRPLAAAHTRAILARARPGYNAIDLLKRVPARICRDYYGLLVDDENQFADWSLSLSALFFSDPTADPATRELASVGADRLRHVVDRSIARARSVPSPDTPIGRLTAMLDAGRLSLAEIHATMLGMVAGFVPTNILAGGNALDVILARPDARAAVDAAVASGSIADLDRAIREAMRFKPIWVGPWRYVPADTVLARGTRRERVVKAGTTVMPATLSAMFDPDVVQEPERFNPDRPMRDSMVFGHGIHQCIGAEMARVQIGECFRHLFALADFRRSKGQAGRMVRLGAYPEQLVVDFTPPPLSRVVEHAMVTVCLPVVNSAPAAAIRARIARLGNPVLPALRQRLDQTGTIHFASLAFVDGETAQDPRTLVLELSGDGTTEGVLAGLTEALEPELRPLLSEFCGLHAGDPLHAMLLRHAIAVSPTFGSNAGLVFSGTPGHGVARIRAEAELAEIVRDMVDEPYNRSRGNAADILAQVRARLHNEGGFEWALQPADSLLEGKAGTLGDAVRRTLAAPRMLLTLATVLVFSWWLTIETVMGPTTTTVGTVMALGTALLLAVLGNLALMLLFGLVAAWLLRRRERRDQPDDAAIALARLEPIQAAENHLPQNHLTAISIIKPGILRRLALRLTFYLISISARMVFRPGYLADLNTIHFARWVVLPGTRRLLFFSNYDGSWESYLEDFIAKASAGLTGVWSNAEGYPRTRWLYLDGARDGERFKRWARRQQVPTLFWYSAYPDLTTGRIRIHSAIRRGIAEASDAQARDWLSLFGSMPPRPISDTRGGVTITSRHLDPTPEVLETGEIQSVFFHAMGRLEHGAVLLFAIPEDGSTAAKQQWLNTIMPQISFGDHVPADRATALALGPEGLRRLGLGKGDGEDALDSFSAAFRQGMGSEARSRILGQLGSDGPDKWRWGNNATPVDGVLLCYAKDAAALDTMVGEAGSRFVEAGFTPVATVRTTVRRQAEGGAVDHFGFRDGVSQPVVRGTQRAFRHPSAMHMVEPGEFLFGYHDEHGFLPASPRVLAGTDPDGMLHDTTDDERHHDFGRNGTFLVVRQFEQHVDRFQSFCRHAAQTATRSRGVETTPEWIGAKMIGRWPDGSSLVRNPDGRTGGTPDNDFSFAAEDSQGLRCPFGSHVRRVNPRDSLGNDAAVELKIANRHRLLRIGRIYEDTTDGGTEKGLMFMCLNADIERQYEFIQQTWVASATFHGLSGETDPLLGAYATGGRFTIPQWEASTVLEELPRFVTTRGGGYFFLPSRSALRYLASRLTV